MKCNATKISYSRRENNSLICLAETICHELECRDFTPAKLGGSYSVVCGLRTDTGKCLRLVDFTDDRGRADG